MINTQYMHDIKDYSDILVNPVLEPCNNKSRAAYSGWLFSAVFFFFFLRLESCEEDFIELTVSTPAGPVWLSWGFITIVSDKPRFLLSYLFKNSGSEYSDSTFF